MAKATSIKEAFKRWEEENGASIIEAKDVQLQFQWPPIDKMDVTLSTLVNCEKLSLSTNMIEKIIGLNHNLSNLKILSLGRNNIKSLTGLEALSDTLEELWVSYNFIDRVRGLETMKKLRVLYIGFNMIREWSEYSKLSALKGSLLDLLFVGNPLMESMEETAYREEATKRLPFLKFLDGEPVESIVEVQAPTADEQ